MDRTLKRYPSVEDDAPLSRHDDPQAILPHAELTEEERQKAIEEIRRRPRIG